MKKFLFVILIMALFVFSSNMLNVNAKSDFNVKIKSISHGDNNGTYASANTNKFVGNDAYFSFSFQRPNDEIFYDVILENTGSASGILHDIKITNGNKDIKTKITGIKIGDKLDGSKQVKVRVTLKIDSSKLDKKNSNVKISFIYEDTNGKLITTSNNPSTFDNIFKYLIIFIVSLSFVLFTSYKLHLGKNMKRNIKISCLMIGVILFTIVNSVVVNALSSNKNGLINLNFDITIDPIEVWDGIVSEVCFKNGTGTEKDPYQIENGKELACFAKSVNDGNKYSGEYVSLTKDIILNENVIDDDHLVENSSELNNWTPIGGTTIDDYNISYFSGIFDGNNHYISGIFSKNDEYSGLFGVTISATIRNLKVVDSYSEGNQYVSIIDSYARESMNLDNIKIDGILISNDSSTSTGSAVGFIYSNSNIVNVNNINTSGFIDGKSSNGIGGVIGMIVGDNSLSINVTNVFNKMKINSGSSSPSAGIIGHISNAGNVQIKSASNQADIKVTNAGTAGIVGRINCNTLKATDIYNTGNIVSANQSTGGLFGQVIVATEGSLKHSYNVGDILSNVFYSGGIIGRVDPLNKDSKFVIDDVYNTGNVKALGGYASGITTLGSSSDSPFEIKNSYNTGNIEIGAKTTYAGGIISNAYYNKSIIIDNCYNKGNVTGYYGIGGILGMGGNVNITNSHNDGNINSTVDLNETNYMFIGGILGHATNGIISDSYNTGEIHGVEETGGIAGDFKGDIVKCYNEGLIHSTFHAGGILGQGTKVQKSYNTGVIDAVASYFDPMYIGGIGGNVDLVEDSYNTGNIETYAYYTGGILGSGTAKSNYNIGNITFHYTNNPGAIAASGIVSSGSAYDSYNLGNIMVTTDNDAVMSVMFIGGVVSMGSANNTVNRGDLTISAPASCIQIGGILGSGPSNNSYNTGNIKIDYFDKVSNIFGGGISGYNASGDNNYSSAKIQLASPYSALEAKALVVGGIFGHITIKEDYNNLNLNNNYVSYDDVYTNYATGSSKNSLFDTNPTNDVNFGKKINSFEVADILSVINKNDSFKIDKNVNNGYPILK